MAEQKKPEPKGREQPVKGRVEQARDKRQPARGSGQPTRGRGQQAVKKAAVHFSRAVPAKVEELIGRTGTR